MAPKRSETRIMAPVLRRWMDSRCDEGRRRKAEGWRNRRAAGCRLHSSPFRLPPSPSAPCRPPARRPCCRPRRPRPARTTRGRHRRRLDLAGQHLERQRQQGIAGQNRRGLVERLVAGGPATPQIVVVHGRQIVVDQRIGVDHLDGAGGRHGRLDRPAAGLRGQQHQHRPQPLARRQQAVTHRFAKPCRAAVAQVRFERQGPRRCAVRVTGQVR